MIVKYRNIELKYGPDDQYSLVNEAMIYDIEQIIGISFPEEYNQFLLASGGGSPNKKEIKTKESREYFKINSRLLNNYSDNYVIQSFISAEEVKDTYKEHVNEIPSGFFVVAYVDGSQDLILLGSDGGYRNKVYGWFESETSHNKNDLSNMYLIAESFNEFLDALLSSMQSAARYETEDSIKESITSNIHFLDEHKDELDWVATESRELSFNYLLLSEFDKALFNWNICVDALTKLGINHSDIGGDEIFDWEHYLIYLELAREEKAAGRSDWRIRFADRLSFIDPDNNPYPYPG